MWKNKTKHDHNLSVKRIDILFTLSGIAFTLIATMFFLIEIFQIEQRNVMSGQWVSLVRDGIFIGIVLYLIYGGLVYQITRLGYLRRRFRHIPASRDDIENIFERPAPYLTILVPSFKEEERIIKQTLMSAALQNYPHKKVVLLIDDPPFPDNHSDALRLERTRSLPDSVLSLLEKPAKRFNDELREYRLRNEAGYMDVEKETGKIIELYAEADAWFDKELSDFEVTDHTDALFREKILEKTRNSLLVRIGNFKQRLQKAEETAPSLEIFRLYRLLAAIFSVEMTSFERKKYINLSHEPNKAMNLNSYISLMGKNLKVVKIEENLHLIESYQMRPNFSVPDSEYIITLDADSLLLSDYALRLIHVMEKPDNNMIAIAQTPYSAVPNAQSLERIAGATTDIQYIIHQGFTMHNATYWVGANALLRKTALDDIVTSGIERGFPIKRYIQDRTVIEDTESTIDLVARGWKLFNYPDRLSYSATPPDFGSLIIQRRRWANGGLIILPKLLQYLISKPYRFGKLAEGFLRFHYLTSLAAVNFGILALISISLAENIFNFWLPLSALPYFVLYSRDLAQIGYRFSDVFRVYALNLMLIPVNLGGVLKSLQQSFTGIKIPFGRTPKVKGRVTTALFYLVFEYIMLILWSVGAVVDLGMGYWIHGIFAVMNTGFLFYAIKNYMGFKESGEDLKLGLSKWRQQLATRKKHATARVRPPFQPEATRYFQQFSIDRRVSIDNMDNKYYRRATDINKEYEIFSSKNESL
jgi:cellulose synthase/poly-beta-1,6-N-acetylglucosamine synthase-like glycosyltransferase